MIPARRLGALVLLLAVGCTRGERAPDLILVTIDTLRPDRIGAYGHAEAHTPTIDALAARGVRFTDATTSLPRTTPALASLLTGLTPRHHGARDVGRAITRGPTLAQVLRERGYFSIGLSANPAADRAQRLDAGFDVFVGANLLPSQTAGDVTRIALKAAGLVDTDLPLFLWTHYLDPHFPYRPPDGVPQPDAPACRALARDIAADQLSHGQAFTNVGGRAAAARDDCLALYDAEIAYADAAVGVLLDGLAKAGRTRHAVVVLTADHGESFGEMGLYFEHGPDVSESGLRIPLVIAAPGVAPAVLDDAVQLEDVTPTLLSLLGVPDASRPGMDGLDFSERVRGTAPAPPERVTLAESGGALNVDMARYPFSGLPESRHCVNDERYSLCATRGAAAPTLHDRDSDPRLERDVSEAHPERRAALEHALRRFEHGGAREAAARARDRKLVALPRLEGGYALELFDPRADPAHEHDLADREPETVERLRATLDPWLADGAEPGAEAFEERTVDALRELGYIE